MPHPAPSNQHIRSGRGAFANPRGYLVQTGYHAPGRGQNPPNARPQRPRQLQHVPPPAAHLRDHDDRHQFYYSQRWEESRPAHHHSAAQREIYRDHLHNQEQRLPTQERSPAGPSSSSLPNETTRKAPFSASQPRQLRGPAHGPAGDAPQNESHCHESDRTIKRVASETPEEAAASALLLAAGVPRLNRQTSNSRAIPSSTATTRSSREVAAQAGRAGKADPLASGSSGDCAKPLEKRRTTSSEQIHRGHHQETHYLRRNPSDERPKHETTSGPPTTNHDGRPCHVSPVSSGSIGSHAENSDSSSVAHPASGDSTIASAPPTSHGHGHYYLGSAGRSDDDAVGGSQGATPVLTSRPDAHHAEGDRHQARAHQERFANNVGLPPRVVVMPHFPSLLHSLLSDSRYAGTVLEWLPHGQGWRVLRWNEMCRSVLPNFFPELCEDDDDDARVDTFLRHVRAWGFREIQKAGKDMGSFRHTLFLRGAPDLCKQMNLAPDSPLGHGEGVGIVFTSRRTAAPIFKLRQRGQQQDSTTVKRDASRSGTQEMPQQNVSSDPHAALQVPSFTSKSVVTQNKPDTEVHPVSSAVKRRISSDPRTYPVKKSSACSAVGSYQVTKHGMITSLHDQRVQDEKMPHATPDGVVQSFSQSKDNVPASTLNVDFSNSLRGDTVAPRISSSRGRSRAGAGAIRSDMHGGFADKGASFSVSQRGRARAGPCRVPVLPPNFQEQGHHGVMEQSIQSNTGVSSSYHAHQGQNEVVHTHMDPRSSFPVAVAISKKTKRARFHG